MGAGDGSSGSTVATGFDEDDAFASTVPEATADDAAGVTAVPSEEGPTEPAGSAHATKTPIARTSRTGRWERTRSGVSHRWRLERKFSPGLRACTTVSTVANRDLRGVLGTRDWMLALEEQLAERIRLARLGKLRALREPEPVFVPGNAARYLRDGRAQLAWTLALVDSAIHRVDLEAYIVHDDPSGRAVRAALVRAARRGVDVRVSFDSVGSSEVGAAFFAPLVAAGGRVVEFHPVAPWRLRASGLARLPDWRPNHRDHRKLLVCDVARAWLVDALRSTSEGPTPESEREAARGSTTRRPSTELATDRVAVALTGGRNVGDEYLRLSPEAGQWLDAGVLLAGPIAARLGRHFDALWEHASEGSTPSRVVSVALDGSGAASRSTTGATLPETAAGSHWVLAAGTQPGLFNALQWSLTRMTRLVKRELRVASAYFIPTARWRRSLTDVARRTGRALVLLPLQSDVPVVDAASRHLLGRLLQKGVLIHRYGAGVLHDKTLVFDRAVTVLGSSNLDPRSFQLNFELSVFVVGADFAENVARAHADAVARSQPYTLAEWSARPFAERARDWASSLLRTQL